MKTYETAVKEIQRIIRKNTNGEFGITDMCAVAIDVVLWAERQRKKIMASHREV